jgi:hypothetical protein
MSMVSTLGQSWVARLGLFATGSLLVLSSCGRSRPANAFDPDVGQGSFSYAITAPSTCQGACKAGDAPMCSVNLAFPNKRIYCDALEDDSINNRCGRAERRARFLKECGYTFTDTNILGYSFSGATCKTEPSMQVFPTRKLFCHDLMDENVHHSCAYAQRVAVAVQYDCPPIL